VWNRAGVAALFEEVCNRAVSANFCYLVHKAVQPALALGPPHCGKSLQSLIKSMTVELIATTHRADKRQLFQQADKDRSARRVLFTCAKRQPATSIGNLRWPPAAAV
jgi:hypothetical protein